MSTYTWPTTLTPMEMTWRYKAMNKVFRSPLNGHLQVASRPGSSLAFDMSWAFLTLQQRAEMMGFIAKLNGQEHWIQIPYYGHVNQGALGGTPVVSGAGQVGASIATSGWPNNTLVLKRGDVVSIGGEMKFITDDATSGVSGLATLSIRPAQRIAPSNGSAIVVTDATGVFMLEDPNTQIETNSLPRIRSGRASIAITEVVSQP